MHISGTGSDLLRYEAASLAEWLSTFRKDLPLSSLRVGDEGGRSIRNVENYSSNDAVS